MTKNFQRCPANLKRSRSFILYFGAAAIWLLATLAPDSARAGMSTDQAVDVTMQVFGAISGVPIPPGTTEVMSGMLGCAMNGQPMGTCTENVAIKATMTALGGSDVLPPEATAALSAAGTCLTAGTSAPDCMKQIAISQLPPEAQPLATCISNGNNLAGCAESVVLNQVLPQLGVSVGAALPQDVQTQLTATVGCVANGSTVSTCAQKLVDSELASNGVPAAVVQGVDALEECAGKQSVTSCATSVATANLPPDAQKLQQCLSGGTSAQTCVANFAAGRIPDPTAAALVGCMGAANGTQVQSCITTNAKSALGNAAQQATQEATQQGISAAQQAITNMQTGLTAPVDKPQFPQAPAILQNMMEVAKGIQDGNWGEVVAGVGPEVIETAGKVILSIFLTPAVGDLLAPVVDSMIQNDVTSFQAGMKDLSNADAVAVGEDLFKWYATTFIQAPCALMPSGAFTNTVCNGLATAINWVANEGGNLAKDILGAGEDVLKAIGVWNFVDNTASAVWNAVTSVIDDIGHFIGLGGDNGPKIVCEGWPSPSDYFANNVLSACLSPASASATANGNALSPNAKQAVIDACVSTYEACPIANKASVTKNCGAMADALATAANNTSKALVPAAYAYAATAAPVIAATMNANFTKQLNPEYICDQSALDQQQATFVSQCATALGGHFQLPTAPAGIPACTINVGQNTALTQACATAFAELSPTVGPNGSLCTKWEASAVSPCTKQVTFPGTDVTITEPDPSKCQLIKPPRGWGTIDGPLKPPPTFPFGIRPPWLQPAGMITPLPLPKIILLPVVFTPFNPPTKGPPKININPLSPRLPPRLVPVGPPQASNGPGHGGTNGVESNSGNSPTFRGSTSGGKSPMDQLGDVNTNSGIASVAGSGNAGGFGPGRPNAPKGLPLGGKPPVVVVGGGKPATGGGGPVNAPSGGHGGIGMVNGSTGNAPTTPAWGRGGPAANGRITPILIKPKPAPAPAPGNQIDYGACPGCGQGGTFVAPK